jgi:hypothetical protein
MPAASATGKTVEAAKPKTTGVMPAANANPQPARTTGLLSRTGMFTAVGATGQMSAASTADTMQRPTGVFPIANAPQADSGLLSAVREPLSPSTGGQPAVLSQMSPVLRTTTGALMTPNGEQATSNTVKLTGPVKVVQVPVAGQPGRFVTGLLPVVQIPKTDEKATEQAQKKPWMMAVSLFLVLLIIGSGALWFVHFRSTTMPKTTVGNTAAPAGTPNVAATATAQAMATVNANNILSDPLTTNIHSWPTNNNEFFQGGAYHVVDSVNNGIAVVLAEKPFCSPMDYALTMYEVKGDDGSVNNSSGMILRFSQNQVAGKKVTTFYSFEVVNTKGGQYRFYKYNDSKGSAATDWTMLWHQNFGNEYHQGQGSKNTNTFKVDMNGKNFTFIVNGKKVGTFQDGSFTCGTVGMLVNLKGTEVAFSNLLITHN